MSQALRPGSQAQQGCRHPSSQARGPASPAAPFYPGSAGEEGWDPLCLLLPSTRPSLRSGLWRKASVLARLPPSLPSTPVGFCTKKVSWASDCPRPVLPTFPLETSRPLSVLPGPALDTPPPQAQVSVYLQPECVCTRHMVWSLK